jgi:hypothetical protein
MEAGSFDGDRWYAQPIYRATGQQQLAESTEMQQAASKSEDLQCPLFNLPKALILSRTLL